MYWREPVDGQSCTMDSTAHYYRFNGRYSHMLEKIFILLMNLSMVYTLYSTVQCLLTAGGSSHTSVTHSGIRSLGNRGEP